MKVKKKVDARNELPETRFSGRCFVADVFDIKYRFKSHTRGSQVEVVSQE